MAGAGWKATAPLQPLTQDAIAYAERMHQGQLRSDGTPYLDHSLEVAALLSDAGAPDHLVAAGVLHDVIEKTDATASDLQERFGPGITALVLSVSDDDRISGYAARKAALRQQVACAGGEALSLFAADKLSKLRELRREATGAPEAGRIPSFRREVRARRLRHYQRSLALLEERMPESVLVKALRSELQHFPRARLAAAGGG
jgi:(p)ppGpp synthase/HD superfamily hydrolase